MFKLLDEDKNGEESQSPVEDVMEKEVGDNSGGQGKKNRRKKWVRFFGNFLKKKKSQKKNVLRKKDKEINLEEKIEKSEPERNLFKRYTE